MTETSKSDADAKQGKEGSKVRHKAAMAAKAASKQARLKAALRDNLRRRKASGPED
jgi:hypothetical protein